MMRHVAVVSAFVLAGALAFACGDDDDGDDKEPGDNSVDGGTQTGLDGGTGGKQDGGAGSCDFTDDEQDLGSCTEAEVKPYVDCVQTACDSNYKKCYGADYRDGNYGGDCGDYMKCASKCDCDDEACQSACKPSAACMQCQSGLVSCGISCFSKLPACATEDGDGGSLFGDAGNPFGDGGFSFGDASVSFDKTCADLLACCNSLSDEADKSECKMVHMQSSMAGGAADIACSIAIGNYCP